VLTMVRERKAGEPTEFGKQVLAWRNARGWSQEQLAKAAGVSSSYVWYLENGQRGSHP